MTGKPDTIFALSSGRPPAAIAVVRVSGPKARFGLETLVTRMPEPRRAVLRKLLNPFTKGVLDDALVLWLPGPATETGEDMVELHLHGGRAVVAAVLETLGAVEGLRPAEAGEFTRRAFENGKLDLTAVEGLADLIAAETEAQRVQALRHYQGLLGDRAEAWRERLIEAMALVEAGIDFSDEGDVPEELMGPALRVARDLAHEIDQVLADGRRGERLREGLVVAIAGPPNAGKSSLLNRLARREAAIVSPHAGTTRDVIEVHLDLEGFPVTLLDTAGVRDTQDPIELEGVRRARARAAQADLVLWITEDGMASDAPVPGSAARVWWIRNKVDLRGEVDLGGEGPIGESGFGEDPIFWISATVGTGIGELVAALAWYARNALHGGEPALLSRARHRHLLVETREALQRALGGRPGDEEVVAEELRSAAVSLGRLTGRIDVEDILDVIFRDFCIGK
ncbi:MAG: tRNA uridine-5-carboxymethylaminomethyl(34) synthesis GTPase MnmE [Bradyrhizobiaceae bacterium]|nr:MAG: tRNA uridine-5-carboxymethylaminomethyl(34) synthesis GTPase MnmE [Bradyrhizobiaceae bacterium]